MRLRPIRARDHTLEAQLSARPTSARSTKCRSGRDRLQHDVERVSTEFTRLEGAYRRWTGAPPRERGARRAGIVHPTPWWGPGPRARTPPGAGRWGPGAGSAPALNAEAASPHRRLLARLRRFGGRGGGVARSDPGRPQRPLRGPRPQHLHLGPGVLPTTALHLFQVLLSDPGAGGPRCCSPSAATPRAGLAQPVVSCRSGHAGHPETALLCFVLLCHRDRSPCVRCSWPPWGRTSALVGCLLMAAAPLHVALSTKFLWSRSRSCRDRLLLLQVHRDAGPARPRWSRSSPGPRWRSWPRSPRRCTSWCRAGLLYHAFAGAGGRAAGHGGGGGPGGGGDRRGHGALYVTNLIRCSCTYAGLEQLRRPLYGVARR